jgi:hypothetical protein
MSVWIILSCCRIICAAALHCWLLLCDAWFDERECSMSVRRVLPCRHVSVGRVSCWVVLPGHWFECVFGMHRRIVLQRCASDCRVGSVSCGTLLPVRSI